MAIYNLINRSIKYDKFLILIYRRILGKIVLFISVQNLVSVIINMSQQVSRNKRHRYKVIDQQKRNIIIDRIINKGEQLKTVSDEIGINVSTCKAIIKVYLEQGRVGKKKTRNKVIDVVETYSFYVLENSKLTQLCPLKITNSKISVGQKQEIQKAIQENCKQKAKQMLEKAVQTHKQVQDAMKQTQANTENVYVPNQANFLPLTFFQPM